MAPTIILTITGLSTFLVPPNSDKINLAITVILGFFFVQTITGDLFPKSDNTPFLAKFTVGALILANINLISCLLCVNIQFHGGSGSPSLVTFYFFYYMSLAMFNKIKLTPKEFRNYKEKERLMNSSIYAKTGKELVQFAESLYGESSGPKSNAEFYSNLEQFWLDGISALNRLFSLTYIIGNIIIVILFLVPLFTHDSNSEVSDHKKHI